jgi:hypothetical protein
MGDHMFVLLRIMLLRVLGLRRLIARIVLVSRMGEWLGALFRDMLVNFAVPFPPAAATRFRETQNIIAEAYMARQTSLRPQAGVFVRSSGRCFENSVSLLCPEPLLLIRKAHNFTIV